MRVKRSGIVLVSSIIIFCLPIVFSSSFVSAASISLTVSEDTMSVNVASIKSNGTFNKSSTSTITAGTDNLTGYTLSIAASNSTYPSRLINGSDNNTSTNHLDSITEPVTEASFSALNSTSYNNKWGYLPSKYHSATNTDFLPAPPTTGDILNVTECANGTTNCPSSSDQYTITLGARVDSSTKIGSYSNHFAILVVANAIPYTIVFDDNVVSNMPTDIDSTSMDESVTLPSNIPLRDGYEFLGWCNVVPTNSNNTDTCSGTQYAASSNYTIDGSTSNNLHLYAMWEKLRTMDQITYMQDRFSCAATAVGTTATLIDNRDGQNYTAAKLPDGNCWMTKNLDLAGGTTLTPADSNVSSDYTLPASSPNFRTGSGAAIVYNSNSTTCSTSSPCYSYYSYTAASKVCPKGWGLPTYNDLNALKGIYTTGATLTENPFHAVYSGTYDERGFGPVSSAGFYWSSSYMSRAGANYYLDIRPTSASITAYTNNYGHSVRCIAQQ